MDKDAELQQTSEAPLIEPSDLIATNGCVTPEGATFPADHLEGLSECPVNSQLSSVPGVIVISKGDGSSSNGDNELSSKQMIFETINADGQAYVLTLHDESGVYHATAVNLNEAPSQDGADQARNEGVSDVSQAWFTSREDKASLQNKGHIWKQGMWSKDEVDLLACNITKYCMENNVIDPSAVIFKMSKDERKDFYRVIAKGLNRPLFSVYRRVIRMYDNKNHIGKYTAEEMKKLKELRIRHGNNWQAIGSEMGRSASSIKDKCRLMKDNCNTGKWFPCEEDRLAEAVYELSCAVPGETVTIGISWASVSERVGTRSEKQCRTKWLNYLNWKQVGGAEWTRDDDVSLITKVCSSDAVDENGVDWMKMTEGWQSVRSPQWLRGKWWSLKRHLRHNQTLSFKEVCAQLYDSHVVHVHAKQAPLLSTTASEPLDAEVSSTILPVSRVTTVTVPHVGMVQAPSIVHVPMPMKHNGIELTSASPDNHPIQTFEVIQPSVHLTAASNPGTFFIAPNQTATIPIATYTPTSSGQIIIQTVTTASLKNSSSIMQMNVPPHIIISTNPATTSNITTFTAPNYPGAIQQLTNVIGPKGEFQCLSQDTSALEAQTLNDAIGDSVTTDDEKSDLRMQLPIDMDPFEPRDVDEPRLTSSDCPSSAIDGHMELEPDEANMSDHLLCDPILQGSNNSPDIMATASSDNMDKGNLNDDSMDGGIVDDES